MIPDTAERLFTQAAEATGFPGLQAKTSSLADATQLLPYTERQAPTDWNLEGLAEAIEHDTIPWRHMLDLPFGRHIPVLYET